MSEVAEHEGEAPEAPGAERFENAIETDEQAQEVMARRRSNRSLLDAAGEAFDTMTAPGEEEETETVPPLAQNAVTAANRAAAVQQARQEPSPAEDEEPPGPDAEDSVEFELPPSAPEAWLQQEPDFEAEAREELDLGEPEPEVQEFEEYEEDPRLREERVRRIAAEKKAAHYETQRLKDARKNWATEAKEHAGLAVYEFGENLEGITATSKREFMRKAAEGHNKVRGIIEATHAPALEAIKEEAVQIHAEAREKAKRSFGEPTAGPGQVPVQAGELAANVAAGREKKGLKGAVRAYLDAGLNP